MNVCPIATVNAPAERIWRLLAEPASYALWWDAETLAIEPPGPAQPGQRIQAETRFLGRGWPVTIRVEAVDSGRRHLELTTWLPFGITVSNHIVCAEVDPARASVTFG
jgi:hypothetical protein